MIPTLDNLYSANFLFTGLLFQSCAGQNGTVYDAFDHRFFEVHVCGYVDFCSAVAYEKSGAQSQMTGSSAIPRRNGCGW